MENEKEHEREKKRESEREGRREIVRQQSRENEGMKDVEKEEVYSSIITCHSSGIFLLCFFLAKIRLELHRMLFHSQRVLDRI